MTPTTKSRALVIIAEPDEADALAAALARLPMPPAVLGRIDPAATDATGSPLRTLGRAADFAALHARYGFTAVLMALPPRLADLAAQLAAECERLGLDVRAIRPLSDLLAGLGVDSAPPAALHRPLSAPYSRPPTIDLARLIAREPHPVDEEALRTLLGGKRVLITGAGGSIGAELARRVAASGPASMALMDRSDNALFDIDRQLAARHPDIPRTPILHDVADADGALRHCMAHRPQVVLHAAAHKHVPLMEDHPALAVANNLFGTKSAADAALAVGAEHFVLISTDKAVNPSSVMGATKRLAERYVRSLNGRGATRCRVVRFGNVLGSASSVLPIWSEQIAEGGPLTLTDPRMTRYFMTIPEAAALVLQAAALPDSAADLYVLDMGEPIRVADLAERFIRLHGCEPDRSGAPVEALPLNTIPIHISGVRPGEKLHEELVHDPSRLRPTGAPGVLAWPEPPVEIDDLGAMLSDLSAVRSAADPALVVAAIARWLPEYARNRVEQPKSGYVRPSLSPVPKAGAA